MASYSGCRSVASYAGYRVSCAGREAVMCGAVLWLAMPDVVLYSVGCTVAGCAGRGVVLCGVVPRLASSYGA